MHVPNEDRRHKEFKIVFKIYYQWKTFLEKNLLSMENKWKKIFLSIYNMLFHFFLFQEIRFHQFAHRC